MASYLAAVTRRCAAAKFCSSEWLRQPLLQFQGLKHPVEKTAPLEDDVGLQGHAALQGYPTIPRDNILGFQTRGDAVNRLAKGERCLGFSWRQNRLCYPVDFRLKGPKTLVGKRVIK